MISKISSDDGTKKCSARENSCQKGLLPAGQNKQGRRSVVLEIISLVYSRWGLFETYWEASVLPNVVFHAHDTMKSISGDSYIERFQLSFVGGKRLEITNPPIHPVSYPKNIPPNAAKAHIRYALKVTGASIRDVSIVPTTTAPPAMMIYFGSIGVRVYCSTDGSARFAT